MSTEEVKAQTDKVAPEKVDVNSTAEIRKKNFKEFLDQNKDLT